MLDWRNVFFVELLGLALFGNAVMPGLGSIAAWLPIWAVLSLKRGSVILGLTVFLDLRSWMSLYAEYLALVKPLFSFVSQAQALVASDPTPQQVQAFVQSAVPLPMQGHLSRVPFIFVALPVELVGFGLAFWTLKKRMKKIRRMTRPIAARLPRRP